MNTKPRLDLNELERKQSIRHKCCEFCGQAIPRSSELTFCMKCQEMTLFPKVRDYIRQNNVNEFQVAEHFNLPLSVVKYWMKERRIEYIDTPISIDQFDD